MLLSSLRARSLAGPRTPFLRSLITRRPSARTYLRVPDPSGPGRVTHGFAPPLPSSLGTAKAARNFSPKTRRRLRRLFITVSTIATLYGADAYFNYHTFSRNFYAVYICALISLDYKLNFNKSKSFDELTKLHERSADRILNLCNYNGGLYQKIGQALAMQSAVLPPVVARKFSQFFDETAQATFKEVEKVLEEEYGTLVPGKGSIADRVFEPGSFERRAVGSASIAQVHKARLKTGEQVAVKVQKPWIQRQVGLDLWCFKQVSYWFGERIFALPIDFLAPYICERLFSETDFLLEAENAKHTARFIQSEPSLRGKVHIPYIHDSLTTPRVLVTEWIDGVPISEKPILTSPYHSPSAVGHSITTPRSILARSSPILKLPRTHPNTEKIFGLGLSPKQIMQTMLDLFCAQMFLFGWVHCDPHPGNILIRRLPSGAPQLVLLDHGLYITTTPEFRHDYALFWKSLLTFDNATIGEIAEKWGIGNTDLFASATLLRPYQGGTKEIATLVSGSQNGGPGSAYEAHQQMRKKLAEFIIAQDRMPKELIFIGRNMRIVQGNNAALGAPVNRIKIIANWASYSLARSMRESGLGRSFRERLRGWWRHVVFKSVVAVIDGMWWAGWVRMKVWGGRGFEEEMEERMKRVVKEELGVELQEEVFLG